MVVKAWEELTLPVFPPHPRYGARAGLPNPRFLDVDTLNDVFLAPFREACWSLVGTVVLEFSPMHPAAYGSPRAFGERLSAFLVHDLKNPLSTMWLHATVLLRAKDLPDDLRESATAIREQLRAYAES